MPCAHPSPQSVRQLLTVFMCYAFLSSTPLTAEDHAGLVVRVWVKEKLGEEEND